MLCTTQAPCKLAGTVASRENSPPPTEDGFKLSHFYSELETWKQRINVAFSLRYPPVDIIIENGECPPWGRYRCVFGTSGWKREVVVNEDLAFPEWGTPEFCLTLGDLLHNLLHAYDDAHGTPCSDDDHNRSYQDHAAALGLVIDDAGVTHYSENSLFTRLLATYRVCTKALFCPEVAIARGYALGR